MDQTDDGPWAASWMCLTIARDALGGFDLNDDGVTLCGAADAHRHRFALIEAKGQWNSGNRGNFHGSSQIGVVWVELWLIFLVMACLRLRSLS